MNVKDIAMWLGLAATIGGAGVGYGRLQARIDALEVQVTEARADAAAAKEAAPVIASIRELKCFVARLHESKLPECP